MQNKAAIKIQRFWRSKMQSRDCGSSSECDSMDTLIDYQSERDSESDIDDIDSDSDIDSDVDSTVELVIVNANNPVYDFIKSIIMLFIKILRF